MVAKALLLCLALAGGFVAPQKKPEAADVLIARANKESEKGDRRILVHFGASWCGPCHELEKFLHEGKIGQILKKYFVIVKMDVREPPEKQALETPGGLAFRTRYAGEKATLPYFAIIDKQGKLYASGDDCPTNYGLIGRFLKVLATGNPKITETDLWALRREIEARL